MAVDWTKTSSCYSSDPFPEVPPSLLNSADIIRYAREGCLVHPFNFHSDFHNPATYTMSLLGTLHFWVQEDQRRCHKAIPIEKGQPIELPPNSISYLETDEGFRLPQYIAARFNLHIRHVHRGILLGTGPVVHPGFVGQLLVPLHNLTANPCKIIGGDRLLWVEFTKFSEHEYWKRPSEDVDRQPPPELMLSRSRNRQFNAHMYFENAGVLSQGVISAFKGALGEMETQVRASETAATRARRTVSLLTGAGIVGLAIGIGTLIFAAWQLWQGNADMISQKSTGA